MMGTTTLTFIGAKMQHATTPQFHEIPNLILSEEQEEAKALIIDWFHTKAQMFFKLFGYAGTGKTTLAAYIVQELGLTIDEVVCAAFTGKAASVIQNKTGIPSYTIHQLTYAFNGCDADGKPVFKMKDTSTLAEHRVKLLILDECSMVTEQNFKDLCSWGCLILALGDPAQLPPIKGVPFFQTDPHYQLEEIQRQRGEAAAISVFANAIRNHGLPTPDGVRVRIMAAKDFDPAGFLLADQVLCGKNDTRVSHNKWQRERRGFTSPLPMKGEKVICLMNNKHARIYNGEMMEVLEDVVLNEHFPTCANMLVRYECAPGVFREMAVNCNVESFNMQYPNVRFPMEGTPFEFGYATTVHKAQGSEWNNIIIMDDKLNIKDPDFRRQWLYTSVTRARETVTILGY